jgi:Uma2 family endonuclease
MSSATPIANKLLTAEEYLALPNDGRRTELLLGKMVEVNQPESLHGFYCSNISELLRDFVRSRKLGRVVSNDAGVITHRGPDTVRGGSVLFYSYSRVPQGTGPRGYWPAPELVFEVRSSSDRWVNVIEKVQEYLEANVQVVVVVDPEESRVHVYTADAGPVIVELGQYLELEKFLPELLPGCRFLIDDFFAE